MCGTMVDIQSATAENRRGKKKERITKKEIPKPQTAKYNVQAIIFRKQAIMFCFDCI